MFAELIHHLYVNCDILDFIPVQISTIQPMLMTTMMPENKIKFFGNFIASLTYCMSQAYSDSVYHSLDKLYPTMCDIHKFNYNMCANIVL